MKNMKRSIALVVAIALMVGCAIGGTMAWLTTSTGSVVNTFTVGDINITLTESDVSGGEKNYNFVPGDTLTKDPKVTVAANSEACYVFIKAVEANNSITVGGTGEKAIEWTVDTSTWTQVPGQTDYWYTTKAKNAAAQEIAILTANTVTVNKNITKDMVGGLTTKKPTLTFTAAAVQSTNMADVNAAWAALPDEFKP